MKNQWIVLNESVPSDLIGSLLLEAKPESAIEEIQVFRAAEKSSTGCSPFMTVQENGLTAVIYYSLRLAVLLFFTFFRHEEM